MAGAAAGAVGGLIGGWFQLGWEASWAPHAGVGIAEPILLVSSFTHIPTPVWLSYGIHFACSTLFGVAYGVLVEFFPIVAMGSGIAFGIAVWIGGHEIIMPWLRLTPPAWKVSIAQQVSEFLGYAIWGFVIGIFYHDLRGRFAVPNRAGAS